MIATCSEAHEDKPKVIPGDGDPEGGFRPMEVPCVNLRSDDDDDEIQWTNDLLHGSAALPLAGLVDLGEQEKEA